MAWKTVLRDATNAALTGVINAANTARAVTTNVLAVQHVGPDGNPQPSGASATSPIYTLSAVPSTDFDYSVDIDIREEIRQLIEMNRLLLVELRCLNIYQQEITGMVVSRNDVDNVN